MGYHLGHTLPALLVMADMWAINSVTFTYSHSFVIIGFFVLFVGGLTLLVWVVGPSFLGI